MIGVMSTLIALQCVNLGLHSDDQYADQETVLVGPISLGQLFANRDRQADCGKEITEAGGPSSNDMLESFKKCQIYIIDRRVRMNKDSMWKFTDSQDFPKLVFEGKTAFSFKIKMKPDLKIWISDSALRGTDTIQNNSPLRKTRIRIELETTPFIKKDGESEVQSSRFTFTSQLLKYEHNSKVIFPLTDSK
jgi:hypothetical protein